MKTIIFILGVILWFQNGQVLGLTGGESAKEGEFPFMVSIKDTSNCHVCGGTIIGDRWILTSNMCYSLAWWSSISFGSIALATNATWANCKDSYNSTIQRRIDDVLYNPLAWDLPPYTHDLVLVHLNESIPFGANIQPVQLSELDEPWPFDKMGTVLGWGYGSVPAIKAQTYLQKAEVPLFSDEYCANSSLWDGWTLPDSAVMKCGGEVNKTYYCSGDHGGPLLVDGKQYGIISYSYTGPTHTCGTFLGIFSPISYFRDWIRDTTGI